LWLSRGFFFLSFLAFFSFFSLSSLSFFLSSSVNPFFSSSSAIRLSALCSYINEATIATEELLSRSPFFTFLWSSTIWLKVGKFLKKV
jgi:hypothetical protein